MEDEDDDKGKDLLLLKEQEAFDGNFNAIDKRRNKNKKRACDRIRKLLQSISCRRLKL